MMERDPDADTGRYSLPRKIVHGLVAALLLWAVIGSVVGWLLGLSPPKPKARRAAPAIAGPVSACSTIPTCRASGNDTEGGSLRLIDKAAPHRHPRGTDQRPVTIQGQPQPGEYGAGTTSVSAHSTKWIGSIWA